MARTKSYMSKVSNKIAYVNKKIRDIEKLFGVGSDQYDRYINVATAALDPTQYHLSESGQLRIKNTKATRESVKIGQVNALTKLPTATRSMQQAKLSMAKNKLQNAGVDSPTDKEIKDEAVTISDQQALQELDDRAFIRNKEGSKGKLNYNESVRADMAQKGKKSYCELRRIIEKGEKINAEKQTEKRAKHAEQQRRYYAAHKEEINARRRERRAQRRNISG